MAFLRNNENFYWPSNRIPYEIDRNDFPPGSGNHEIIIKGIHRWNSTKLAHLYPRRDEYNYVVFVRHEEKCESWVGMKNGPQNISCALGTHRFNAKSIAHEIGHALGYFHEHQRPERDNFVTIGPEGVNDETNFGIRSNGKTIHAYDCKSIMHYWEIENKIKPKVDSCQNMGRSPYPTFGDLQAATWMLKPWKGRNLFSKAGIDLRARGTPTSYVDERDQTQHVIFRGEEGNIHDLSNQLGSDDWRHSDLTSITRAPKAQSDPGSYIWDSDGSQHIVYRSRANDIIELSTAGADWKFTNLSRLLRSPKATGVPMGYSWDVDDTHHIVFRGRDGKIHEFYFTQRNEWTHNRLTDRFGFTRNLIAISDPWGYTWDEDHTQHILFLGRDFHIHEFYYDTQNGWSHNDLMSADPGRTPRANHGTPMGYTWDVDKTQHVIYRGMDDKIHELYYKTGVGWRHNNLTNIGNAPLALNTPFGYSSITGGTQHIIFRNPGGNISELSYKGGVGWRYNWPIGAANSPFMRLRGRPVGHEWKTNGTQHIFYQDKNGHIQEIYIHQSELRTSLTFDRFVVNKNAQSNGDHEVHNATKGCDYMPDPENQLILGSFPNCKSAVDKAKESYSRANGCYYCANECHTS